MDQTIEESVKKAKYREAVDTLKRAGNIKFFLKIPFLKISF